MDFSWNKEQNALYSSVVAFAHEKLGSKTHPTLQRPFWTRKQWSLCGEAGVLGLSLPVPYGGRGYGALTTARAIEALGYGCEDTGLIFSLAAHLFACGMPVAEYGNEQQKHRFLPGFCTGKYVAANAITEKEAGSDVFALKTQAVRDGDAYILTGTKSYVSNGPLADVFVVYASTKPAHGYMGISCFILERDSPGLLIGEPFTKLGLTSTAACEISLQACRVPLENLLGREGQGAEIFKRSMQWERACLFALYVGMMERQLKRSVAYARERRQFGKALIKNQAIAHRLADMKLRLESARLLLYHACWLFDQDQSSLLDIALSKLAISEAAILGSLDAIHIHGAVGIDVEANLEVMLRDSIPSAIFSGTSEIQRDIIASELEV